MAQTAKRTRRPPKITREEVGNLQAVHRILSGMIERASSPQLAGRLNRVFDILPSSDTNGLEWGGCDR